MKEKFTAQDTFKKLKEIPLNLEQIDYLSLEMEDVCRRDHPDYCDAFIADASWLNGRPLTDAELEQLNEHSDIVYEAACISVYG